MALCCRDATLLKKAVRHRMNTPRLKIFFAFSYSLKRVKFCKDLCDYYVLSTIEIILKSGDYKPASEI